MDLSIYRMIFFETSHALGLGSDKTKVKFCMFQWCTPAEIGPILAKEVWIDLTDLAKCDLNLLDPSFRNLPQHLLK